VSIHPLIHEPIIALKNVTIGNFLGPRIKNLTWVVYPGESWVVCGGNASGKTSLAQFLSGQLSIIDGSASLLQVFNFSTSWETIVSLRIRERQFFTGDDLEGEAQGTTAMTWYLEQGGNVEWWEEFHLPPNSTVGLKNLSTGEIKKVFLALGLSQAQKLLVLDCPLDGLDAASRPLFFQILTKWKTPEKTLILFLRPDQFPVPLSTTGVFWLPSRPTPKSNCNDNSTVNKTTLVPIVEWKNGLIRYQDRILAENINFTISQREAWRLSGPNGCGKSTLLSILVGENSQAFTNDLKLFGKRRGPDLPLDELRKRIRWVSHKILETFDQRFWGKASEVVLSGWTNVEATDPNSTTATAKAVEIARSFNLIPFWDYPFHRLSPSLQMTILAARACLTRPELLILDEPDQFMDPYSLSLLYEQAKNFISQGTAVILVTHQEKNVPSWITHQLAWQNKTIV